MFAHTTRKLSIQVLKSKELQLIDDYDKITTYDIRNPCALHAFGALYRLAKEPERYNPSIFGLARLGNVPVCLSSLTSNLELSSAKKACELTSPASTVFPNVEIMAYTKIEARSNGIASKTIAKILEETKLPKNTTIYVYSQRMERLIKKLGYPDCTNLHEYSL